ncbi:MAG: LPS export ABC transporter periplasmic protein LptC [Gammaproteobacteria bacterium]|nr:MAG: LPS export ABC transporter periplasmic protein LptC [Gammaproteobacteria bacterium]
MRTFLSLLVVFALALISIWFQDLFKEPTSIIEERDEHFPDYFMENFSVTQMNDQGQTAYVLQARRMQHFADDDSSEIEAPNIQLFDDKGNWTIVAQRALIHSNQSVIHLYDQVQLTRNDTTDPLSIETDYLRIDTDTRIADTDRPAHVKTRELELDSLGIMFDNRQGILKLKSRVRGRYAPIE